MGTEVESRYMVPDRVLFNKLIHVSSLGGYAVQPEGIIRMTDHYLDTKGRALLRQGWACRLRAQNGSWVVTVKGPKANRGAILSRPELEMALVERIEDIARWPEGEIRSLVRELTGGLPLQQFLTIRQSRHRFSLSDGSRHVAELSLDVVRLSTGKLRHLSYMLECELLEQGELADLERLHPLLVNSYYLVPETRSKLQRALELVDLERSPDEGLVEQPAQITVEALCQRYDADMDRAEYVAGLAGILCEQLQPVHKLPSSKQPLVHMAALLHNVGEATKHARRNVVSRDILLRHSIVGLDAEAQQIVASAAYLHRQKITPQRIEEALAELPSVEVQQQAQVIAALVRLASALDASGTESTTIDQVHIADGGASITVSGPYADEDARRARLRSDLWEFLFGQALEWQVAGAALAGDASFAVDPPKGGVGLLPSDTMTEAARKVLRMHLERMLEHEPGARLGQDPEELHDMRVATRRLRSALGLFRAYLHGAHVTPTGDGLRELARVLGEVRDTDVALAKAQSYLANLPPFQAQDLDVLLTEWRARRDKGREQLLAHLDSQRYRDCVRDLSALIEDLRLAAASQEDDHTVKKVAPRFLYIAWQIVHAYDAVLRKAPVELLHALRIDCKRLRYALEFLREALPPEVTMMIPEVVTLQDHLGDLNDAAVATEMLDEIMAQRQGSPEGPAITAYREARQEELVHLVKTFPSVWQHFRRPKLRRKVTKALLLGL